MRHVIMRTTVATIQGPAADDDDGDDDDSTTTRRQRARRRDEDEDDDDDDDDDDDATTRACAPHGIFCKGLWPLAGARRPLKERAKVARASSCNINVEKPLVL